MQFTWWVVLSTKWKREDVQAGLVVVISVLSFLAVYTSARYFWHSNLRRISKHSDVPISSLLSFTTLGEVVDVIVLLKSKIFSTRYFALAVQCFLVIAFSACAILAGPISRFATNVGSKDLPRPSKGLLASQSYNCELNQNIRWHNISESLDKAKFPHNQLLDYLPDTSSDWVYHPEDWNSTWTATCSVTAETNITLEAVGNYTTGSAYYIYDNIPGLSNVYTNSFLTDKSTQFWWYFSGTKVPRDNKYESLIFYQYAEMRPDGDQDKKWDNVPTQRISVHLSAIAMHDAPMYEMSALETFDYEIGKGKIPYAWYTKVECDLTRNKPITKVDTWEAWVDTPNTCSIAENMDQYFSAPSTRTSGSGSSNIKLPTGNELFRYYQSYTISKDTHYPRPVTRNINLRVPTVELSTVFIGIMSFFILFTLVGLIHMLVFYFNYNKLYDHVPETKVDWLLQSLREAETSGAQGHGKPYQTHFHSPSNASDDGGYQSYNEKSTWEKASYSLARPHQTPPPPFSEGDYINHTRPQSQSVFGRVSVHRHNHTPAPERPASLVPGPLVTSPSPRPFSTFVNNNARNGYSPVANPEPYTNTFGGPNYTNSPTISESLHPEHIVTYGMGSAKMQPVVTVGPQHERNEWQVGVVENKH